MPNIAQQQAAKDAAIRIDRALNALSSAQAELEQITRYSNRGCLPKESIAEVNIALRAILRHSIKLQTLLDKVDPIGGVA